MHIINDSFRKKTHAKSNHCHSDTHEHPVLHILKPGQQNPLFVTNEVKCSNRSSPPLPGWGPQGTPPKVSGVLILATALGFLEANGLRDEPRAYQTEGGIQEAEVSATKTEKLEVHIRPLNASECFGEQKGPTKHRGNPNYPFAHVTCTSSPKEWRLRHVCLRNLAKLQKPFIT